MIGLDTNVLVRYLTQDDPNQARKATRRLEADADAAFFISTVVLCEIVWVLESAYGYPQDQIAHALQQILQTKQFEFEDKDLIWQALSDYLAGAGDFSDHLIGRIGARAGCRHTMTFDRRLKSSANFEVL